jgi:Leucine-rich repeat (LRR) protein
MKGIISIFLSLSFGLMPLFSSGMIVNSTTKTSFSCTTITEIPVAECEVLVALFNATNGAGWDYHGGWFVTAPAGWYGITVTDGHVTSIYLNYNNLVGTLPSAWSALSYLQTLDLGVNQISGTIPSGLTSLTSLQTLALNENQLSGTIPSELGSMSNLQTLDLSYNDLSGNIPIQLSNMSALMNLNLGGNSLSGIIPPELGNLSNLGGLNLSWNSLSGTIPTELASLNLLQDLVLDGNSLTGTIPPELGTLNNLWILNLADNQLSGSIPSEIGDLSNLLRLNLNYNQLSGSIPSELGNLSNLTDLFLGDNSLSGSIPTELGNLSNLQYLSLQNNQLNGSVPLELGNLSNLWVIDLHNNQLNGSIPPELGNLTNLNFLLLDINQLSGDVPASLANLVNLCNPGIGCSEYGLNLGYNRLNVPAAEPPASYLVAYDPDWNLTQAISVEIPAEGGTLQSRDGKAQFVFPAGSVPAGTTITYIPLPLPQHTTGDFLFGGISFELLAEDSSSDPVTVFSSPVTVTLNYDEADLSKIYEPTLTLNLWIGSVWEDGAGTCTPSSSYIRDLAGNHLTVDICHMTEFALLGTQYQLFLPMTSKP